MSNDAVTPPTGEDETGDDELVCQIRAARSAYRGRLLHVEELEVELPNGKLVRHETVRHPGAVGIVALDERSRVLLVRQYRTPLARVTLEIPAGKIDAGEQPEACARRELAEETGLSAREISPMASLAIAAGYSDEILHLYRATGLVPCVGAEADEDEFVATVWVALSELLAWVRSGRVQDSKTVIAALMLAVPC
ncbi:MAG: NUDIX hydrolase [Coriobacteriales bacterium]|jgi:ADP-ribose pyrophosphatase|nr:NUDIX hydrolase [Coriobacteriales bacterium]